MSSLCLLCYRHRHRGTGIPTADLLRFLQLGWFKLSFCVCLLTSDSSDSMHLHALWPKSKSSPSDASQVLFDYSRFFCAVDGMDFFFCNPLCPACNVDFGFGAMMGSTLLGWVPSMYQRVRRVGLSVVRGPPSTSNNQPLMLVDRRFFHSDVVACQSRVVLLESCLLTFVSAANATIGSLQNQGADSERPCLSLG